MPSEKECVEREREAFAIGCGSISFEGASNSIKWLAENIFPLPTVTRPRVEPDPNGGGRAGLPLWWIARNGIVMGYCCLEIYRHDWSRTDGWPPHEFDCPENRRVTPERVALWADLLANPTEEVEE